MTPEDIAAYVLLGLAGLIAIKIVWNWLVRLFTGRTTDNSEILAQYRPREASTLRTAFSWRSIVVYALQAEAIGWLTWWFHEGRPNLPVGQILFVCVCVVAFATGLIVNLWDWIARLVRGPSGGPAGARSTLDKPQPRDRPRRR